jgi:ribosomal protein S27AE
MSDLLPCPFCGGGAVTKKHWLLRLFRVYCGHCGIGTYWLGQVMDCPTPPADRLSAAWNRRAPLDEPGPVDPRRRG